MGHAKYGVVVINKFIKLRNICVLPSAWLNWQRFSWRGSNSTLHQLVKMLVQSLDQMKKALT